MSAPPIPPQRTRRRRFDVMLSAGGAGSLSGIVKRHCACLLRFPQPYTVVHRLLVCPTDQNGYSNQQCDYTASRNFGPFCHRTPSLRQSYCRSSFDASTPVSEEITQAESSEGLSPGKAQFVNEADSLTIPWEKVKKELNL